MRKILYDEASPFLSEFIARLDESSKLDVVLFALYESDCLLQNIDGITIDEKNQLIYARHVIEDWSKGLVKMPIAKRAILSIHTMAKSKDCITEAQLHAIAQAWSSIHAKRHVLGFLFYHFTALHHRGLEEPFIETMMQFNHDLDTIKAVKKTLSGYAEFLRREL